MRVTEDLQLDGLRIIVEKPGFTYGHDAVLLSDFARPGRGERLIDLCSGTGILAILLNAKRGCTVTAVELQQDCADMARESAAMNGQSGITVLCADIRTLPPPDQPYDCAVCNPPYHAGGTLSPDGSRRISTHQQECGIFDAAACGARMIKNGGRMWLSYPAGRLAECFHALRHHALEPKRLKLVEGRGGRPYLALIEAKKGGGVGLIFE